MSTVYPTGTFLRVPSIHAALLQPAIAHRIDDTISNIYFVLWSTVHDYTVLDTRRFTHSRSSTLLRQVDVCCHPYSLVASLDN